ncbi:RNA polymerase III transcription initiation factor complex component [Trichoderma austrokoningii]
MPLETIYVVRHGFRSSWSVDHTTGVYSASIPSPTGIAVDPALTAHGVDQSRELGRHLTTLDPPVEAVYSSPYYRCLQTITPFVELQQQQQKQKQACGDVPSATTIIRPEHGLCEWFGSAPFEHPGPASPAVLKSLFPAFDESYVSAQHPPRRGETLAQLQARLTATMQSIIDRCDAEDRRAVVLCTHAAVVITLGRILTGCFPETVDTDDFRAFTCGVSVYRRKRLHQDGGHGSTDEELGPNLVVGGWTCKANSDCSFLTGGEERGWYVLSQTQSKRLSETCADNAIPGIRKFAGDEEFPDTGSMSNDASEPKL